LREATLTGGVEFGVERLKGVIAGSAKDALQELVGRILALTRAFGAQFDDQTIPLVRRLRFADSIPHQSISAWRRSS
jgi:hypothetical protein